MKSFGGLWLDLGDLAPQAPSPNCSYGEAPNRTKKKKCILSYIFVICSHKTASKTFFQFVQKLIYYLIQLFFL